MARISTSRYDTVYRYEVAEDTGTVGVKVLRGPTLPAGAIVTDAVLVVDTALTGGTVTDTLSLGLETATDVQAAAARNASPWSSTGARHVTLSATAAPVRVTADDIPSLTINGSALTAGKLRLIVTVIEAV
jgi:hypothetical protein